MARGVRAVGIAVGLLLAGYLLVFFAARDGGYLARDENGAPFYMIAFRGSLSGGSRSSPMDDSPLSREEDALNDEAALDDDGDDFIDSDVEPSDDESSKSLDDNEEEEEIANQTTASLIPLDENTKCTLMKSKKNDDLDRDEEDDNDASTFCACASLTSASATPISFVRGCVITSPSSDIKFLKRPIVVSPEAMRPLHLSPQQNLSVALASRDTEAGACWEFPEARPFRKRFRCLPSVIVAGFQRASTRELHDWLEKIPTARGYPPNDPGKKGKSIETHFFDSLSESKPFHGLQPTRRERIKIPFEEAWRQIYLSRWSPALSILDLARNDTFVFEKTPAYTDEIDPRLLFRLLPGVSMIFSMRHPAARVYSEYWRRCGALGRRDCSVEDFKEAILRPALRFKDLIRAGRIEEFERLAMESKAFPSGYEVRSVALGHYAHFIERYIEAHAAEARNASRSDGGAGRQRWWKASSRVLLIFSESFRKNPFSAMEEIQGFLRLTQPLDFRKVARPVVNKEGVRSWVVSDKSKALEVRPKGYVPMPRSVGCALFDIYRDSLLRLKSLVNKARELLSVARDDDEAFFPPLQVVPSIHEPEWFANLTGGDGAGDEEGGGGCRL